MTRRGEGGRAIGGGHHQVPRKSHPACVDRSHGRRAMMAVVERFTGGMWARRPRHQSGVPNNGSVCVPERRGGGGRCLLGGILGGEKNSPPTWQGWSNAAKDAYQAGPFDAGGAALSRRELCEGCMKFL